MNIFVKSIIFGVILSLTTLSAAFADTTSAKLSKLEKEDILRMETYLNTVKNVRADFMQVSDMGTMRLGKIALSRPGKMRVDYDAPDKDFIVADGFMVHMWDDEMQSQTSVPVGEGIASFILRDPISLTDGDITITRFARYPAKIEVSIVSTEAPDEGELTLVFKDKPLKLSQWKVLDPQGRITGVNLQNTEENVKFKSNKFVFVSPKFGKPTNTGL